MTVKVDKRAVFKEVYTSLNTAQKQAVDTIEGPVMVVAGPGTGKTQILTLRIANILTKTDSTPENILALTFTESGAKAMRERLFSYIGSEAYRVAIHTFHGFSQQLIHNYPDAYPHIIGGVPASDLEKIDIIETILESGEVDDLRPGGNPQYYVKPVQSMISNMKREYVTPDIFSEIITEQEKSLLTIEQFHTKGAHKGKVRGEYKEAEKSLLKNKALLYVYRQYQALLRERNLFDFDDMILETVDALKSNEDMLRDLQETYHYILADEHQDVNGAQNEILECLASYHEHPNIFVVGDEKQAIFRFQGASLENFLYFTDIFPDTTSISLTDNYRSGQKILDAAHSLVAKDEGPLKDLRIPLDAVAVKSSLVSKKVFSHQAVEDNWVASEVKKNLEQGVEANEIAVIVRSNREVEELTSLLRKNQITAQPSADSDILHNPITYTVENLLKAVVGTDSSSLFGVLHSPYWGIDRSDLVRVLSAQRRDRNLEQIISDKEILKEVGVKNLEPFEKVNLVLKTAREKSLTEAPHEVLAELLNNSGLKEFLITSSAFEAGRVIRRLYDEVEDLVRRKKVSDLSSVVNLFTQSRDYNLSLNAPFIPTSSQAVQVMTAHKSKGLEFKTVIVPHVHDNAWGGRASRQLFKIKLPHEHAVVAPDQIDDERRLLYVAMTRAKENLVVSYSDMNSEGKELLPSRLLADISNEYIETENSLDIEETFDPLADISVKSKDFNLDSDTLTTLVSQRGFSATSINNYVSSPWNYFYKNILRIPEIQPAHMLFGTSIHSVLERVVKEIIKSDSQYSDTYLKSCLDTALNQLPLSTENYTRLHEKGFSALLTYIDKVKSSWPKEMKTEFSIKVEMETGIAEIPTISLTGNLDRLDFSDGKVSRVVDYKTGKPKTRNVIEGNTKNSDGGYKRQLVFYALLLDLYDDERYKCRTGTLSFVEPDSHGEIHEETFEITDNEIAELRELIIKATKEICSGEFLNTDCDNSVCDYCHLVDIWKGDI